MPRTGNLQLIKYSPPPSDLPVYQGVRPEDVSFFGRTNYEAALDVKKFIFGIKREDRKRHMYIVGKSGAGKTKLLELLVRQDVAYNYGFCLFDPHGDLIENILDFIPEDRMHDVVIIDPTDHENAVSFNPFANVHPELRHPTAQGFVEAMERQFGVNWTPRLEHVVRFGALALLDYPEANLVGMIDMLTDPEYRAKVIPHIKDAMVERFWKHEFLDWQTRFNEDTITPLLTKLEQLLAGPFLHNIFAQTENKIDMASIVENGQILLVNLSRNNLGEENANFLGTLLLVKLHQAAATRPNIPGRKKKDFYLYVDEFYGLVTNTFERFFTEARRYGVCITVVNQYASQVAERTRQLVLGNTDTIIVFRVGGEDTKWLEAEMTPVFKAKDMINLGAREFYIKMIINGNTSDPFSAETLAVLPPTHKSFKDQIIFLGQNKYGKPQGEIHRKDRRIQPDTAESMKRELKEEIQQEKPQRTEDSGGISLDSLPIKE